MRSYSYPLPSDYHQQQRTNITLGHITNTPICEEPESYGSISFREIRERSWKVEDWLSAERKKNLAAAEKKKKGQERVMAKILEPNNTADMAFGMKFMKLQRDQITNSGVIGPKRVYKPEEVEEIREILSMERESIREFIEMNMEDRILPGPDVLFPRREVQGLPTQKKFVPVPSKMRQVVYFDDKDL